MARVSTRERRLKAEIAVLQAEIKLLKTKLNGPFILVGDRLTPVSNVQMELECEGGGFIPVDKP